MSSGSKQQINLSVSELIQFCVKEGDYISEKKQGPSSSEGIEAHKKIQKSHSLHWNCELPVSHTFTFFGFDVRINGKVDLIDQSGRPISIIEIKSCYGPGYLINEQMKNRHWAQVKIYAALYFMQHIDQGGTRPNTRSRNQNDSKEIKISLLYFDVLSKQIYKEHQLVSSTEVIDFCFLLMKTYLDWWSVYQDHRTRLVQGLKELTFPFKNYRPEQRETALKIYRNICESSNFLLEAPTGSGKTLSVMFPSLKALALGKTEKIVYLTCKNSAQINIVETLKKLNQNEIDYLVLQSKEKSCPCKTSENESVKADNLLCSRLKGYYDRLPEARLTCIREKKLDRDSLLKIANQYHLCPFALSQDLAPWFSIIIADINYWFDPVVKLHGLEAGLSNQVLLVDEVHNMPVRARDMYSAKLACTQLVEAIECLPKQAKELKSSLKELIRIIKNLEPVAELPRGTFFRTLNQVRKETIKIFEGNWRNSHSFQVFATHFYRFWAIYHLFSETHYVSLSGNKNQSAIELNCLDPSKFLGDIFQKFQCFIGFSSTLAPFEFYKNGLGLPVSTKYQSMSNQFPKENQLNLCATYIRTEPEYRDASLLDLIQLIHHAIHFKKGNYLVFLPSYPYLESVFKLFIQTYPDVQITRQIENQKPDERDAFIHSFMDSKTAVVGFAILGGIFAEGIDYRGESLIGSIIVGTGMPHPDKKQKRLADYYRNNGQAPYQYAYQIPGYTRLRQTAGRLIRSEIDRGVIIYIEPRLARKDYRTLFEPVRLNYCPSLKAVKQQLRQFWQTDRDSGAK